MSSILYIKFCKNANDAEAREGMVKGCLLASIGFVLLAVVAVVGTILGTSSIGAAIGMLVDSVVFLYYLAVCKRYAGQA